MRRVSESVPIGSGLGFDGAFGLAVNAAQYARQMDMIVCLSVCCTREFTSPENLYNYLELAHRLDVSFVQLLEPKAVGHYAGRDVKLSEEQTRLLRTFYEDVNFNSRYKNYPIVIYHGYYQPVIGCFSAGNRALYVDTNAEVMNCPFCKTSSGNLLHDDVHNVINTARANGCTAYFKPVF